MQENRVLIMAGARCIGRADFAWIQRVAGAPNVRLIRERRTKTVVRVELEDYGDDSRLESRGGNPLKLSTNRGDTFDTPANVWRFKRLFAVDGAA